jgi:hypothetical protein
MAVSRMPALRARGVVSAEGVLLLAFAVCCAVAGGGLGCRRGSAEPAVPAPPEDAPETSEPEVPGETDDQEEAAPPVADDDPESLLAAVARVHGRAGPFAVAGYRIGIHALDALGAQRGDRSLVVTHHTPEEVRYSCIADGVQAATGVSLGQLTLTLEDAPPDDVHTEVRRRDGRGGRSYRLAPALEARMAKVPPEGLVAAGRLVAELPEDQVFEVVELPPGPPTADHAADLADQPPDAPAP